MAKVTLYVPDDVLAAFRAVAGDDAPSMSSMIQECLRRFVTACGDGTWRTTEQRIETLECDLETLIRMLRNQGVNV